MDHDFWKKFYESWDLIALVSEIDTCFLYQQNCLRQSALGQSDWQYQLRQMMQSQERTKVIIEVIRSKENGISASETDDKR